MIWALSGYLRRSFLVFHQQWDDPALIASPLGTDNNERPIVLAYTGTHFNSVKVCLSTRMLNKARENNQPPRQAL